MAAREGMTSLITRLREMTSTENTGEDALNGTQYWTDDQLQDYLDDTSTRVIDIPLEARPFYESGTFTYRFFYIPLGTGKWIEEPTSSSNVFHVVDSLGNEDSTTLYTFDQERNEIEYTTDLETAQRYWRGVVFDLNAAAANVWETKASMRYQYIEARFGGHWIKADQEFEHCKSQAKYYRSKRGLVAAKTIKRGYKPRVQ